MPSCENKNVLNYIYFSQTNRIIDFKSFDHLRSLFKNLLNYTLYINKQNLEVTQYLTTNKSGEISQIEYRIYK